MESPGNRGGNDIDVTKLTKEERGFVTGIINRLDSGDAKGVGTELRVEFKTALTPRVFQKGYRLGDVLCQGDGAHSFNANLWLRRYFLLSQDRIYLFVHFNLAWIRRCRLLSIKCGEMKLVTARLAKRARVNLFFDHNCI